MAVPKQANSSGYNNDRLDACKDGKVVQWCGTQASSHYVEYVTNYCINDVDVYTVTPDRCTVLCC